MDEFSKSQIEEIERILDARMKPENLSVGQKKEVNDAIGKWLLAGGSLPIIAIGAAAWFGMRGAAVETAADLAPKISAQTVIKSLFESREFSDTIREGSSNIPVGSVIIFDRVEGCPTNGWEPLSKAAGKVIIGVGSGILSNDETVLTARGYDNQGGKEKVAISLKQIPPHNHRISTSVDNSTQHNGLSGKDNETVGIDLTFSASTEGSTKRGGHGPLSQVLEFVGDGESHENMPPFVALYFCKKIA